MIYEKELEFLRKTFSKFRIKTAIMSADDNIESTVDEVFFALFKNDPDKKIPIKRLCESFDTESVYKIRDALFMNYLFFALSDGNDKNDKVLLVGPYLSSPLTAEEMLEAGERLGISLDQQKTLERYYSNIPVVAETSQIFALVDTYCEIQWGNSVYNTVDVSSDQSAPNPLMTRGQEAADINETLASMKIMEERYSWENEIIRTVSLGQSGKVNRLVSMLSDKSFEKRTSDQLRNMKNYCIIMNTILRKAAEQGGVHPMYLDSASSAFAIRIEQIESVSGISELMPDMLNTYTRLVRKHALSEYSLIIQKTILIIEADLSADLSLSLLAKAQNISEGYLSSLFKKETGKTVTEYIRERRIKHAKHLLKTTQLQIQTVALHCGIMDVQYFSKLFKREVGKSPKEYRESLK